MYQYVSVTCNKKIIDNDLQTFLNIVLTIVMTQQILHLAHDNNSSLEIIANYFGAVFVYKVYYRKLA